MARATITRITMKRSDRATGGRSCISDNESQSHLRSQAHNQQHRNTLQNHKRNTTPLETNLNATYNNAERTTTPHRFARVAQTCRRIASRCVALASKVGNVASGTYTLFPFLCAEHSRREDRLDLLQRLSSAELGRRRDGPKAVQGRPRLEEPGAGRLGGFSPAWSRIFAGADRAEPCC